MPTKPPTNNPTFSPSNFPTSHPLTEILTPSTTITTPSKYTTSFPTMAASLPTELVSGWVTHTTTDLVVIYNVKEQHADYNDYMTVILMILWFVLYCIVVFCIRAIYLMNTDKNNYKNDNHDQSKIDIVNSDNSGCSNDNDIPISSIQLTAITVGETVGGNDSDLKMKHDEVRSWLESASFPEYLNNFVLSGYESIDFIKEIQNELELQEIGINSKSECNQILCAIERLRMEVIHEMKDAMNDLEAGDDHATTTNTHGYR